MKDKYEQLLMQEETAMGTQIPQDWRTGVGEIIERTRELLKNAEVAYIMQNGGIHVQDENYELDALSYLLSALEDISGRGACRDMLEVYDIVFV